MSTSQNCSCCRQASVQEQSASVKPAVAAETGLASDAKSASSRLFSRRATLVTGALASTAALASCAEGGGTKVTAPDGTVDMAAASSVGVGKAAKADSRYHNRDCGSAVRGPVQGVQPRVHASGMPVAGTGFDSHRMPLPRFGVRARRRFGGAWPGGDPVEDLPGSGEGRPYFCGK